MTADPEITDLINRFSCGEDLSESEQAKVVQGYLLLEAQCRKLHAENETLVRIIERTGESR